MFPNSSVHFQRRLKLKSIKVLIPLVVCKDLSCIFFGNQQLERVFRKGRDKRTNGFGEWKGDTFQGLQEGVADNNDLSVGSSLRDGEDD